MTDHRARAGVVRSSIALFLVLLAVNILFWPARLYPADTGAWLLEAKELLDHQSLDIRSDVPELLTRKGQFFVENDRNHLLYSKYGIASSIVTLPAIWLARQLPMQEVQAKVLSLNIEYAIAAALLGVILYILARRIGASTFAACTFVIAALYGTFAWQYLRAHTMDLFLCLYFCAWLLLMGLWREKVRGESRDRPLLVIAIWLMVLMLCATRGIFILMAPITIGFFAREILAAGNRGRAVQFLAGSILPAMGICLVLGAVNHIKFGAWYYSGYHQWGQENTPSIANVMNLYEFIVDPHFSPLIVFPVFTIGLFCARRFWNEHREEYLLVLVPAVIIGAIYLLTSNWRGEWSEGPRYFLFALPGLSLPFILVLQRLLATTTQALSRLCLLLLVAWILWTGTMQYLVLCRPFSAYYTNLTMPVGIANRRFAKLTTLWPRGYTMQSVWSSLRNNRRDPFLEAAHESLTSQEFERYIQGLASEMAPCNLWWFRESE